jgi:hypothetical protein
MPVTIINISTIFALLTLISDFSTLSLFCNYLFHINLNISCIRMLELQFCIISYSCNSSVVHFYSVKIKNKCELNSSKWVIKQEDTKRRRMLKNIGMVATAEYKVCFW